MASLGDLRRWAKRTGGKSGKKVDAGALKLIKSEAKAAGATLAHDGKGGVPTKLALKVFRHAKYRCEQCGTKINISLHHKGGILDSKKDDEAGHEMTASNLEVLCESYKGHDGCHDKDHREAREKGIDSSQIKPKGDGGPGLSAKR